MWQSELTEFFAELTDFAPKLSEAQWVLFSETVLLKQYSACDPAGLVQITQNPESQKYEKITKKIQNPPSRDGARKYEKITENSKMA